MTPQQADSDRRRAWTLGCGTLAIPVAGLSVLAWAGPAAWRGVALIVLAFLAFVGYESVVLTLVVRMAGLGRGLLSKQELLLRSWVARFAKDPEGLWIHWAGKVSSTELGLECLERAAPLGPTGAFELGLAYAEGPAKDLAIPWFRRAAEQGHGGAMLRLAESLRWGTEGVRDPEEAQRWQSRVESMGRIERRPFSVLRGREEAAGRVAAKAEDFLDLLWAKPWMPWIALAAFALLLPVVGLYLAIATLLFAPLFWAHGRFVNGPRRNLSSGLKRMVARAEAGDAGAAAELGRFYLEGGHGLPKDPLSAQLWFRRAAEGGDVEAMVALAEMLASGHGVVRDANAARQWFGRAAQAGHPRAAAWLTGHPEAS